jgi:EXLDI family protein
MMPNKTIYVSEDDLPLLERAQAISGDNLSATISLALGLYVKQHETKEKGFEPVTLKVGKVAYAMKRFEGKLLAKAVTSDAGDKPSESFEVYQTPKANLVVYRATPPTYSGFPGPDGTFLSGQTEYRLDVCSDSSELYSKAPAELVDVVRNILEGHEVEELDI